MQMEDALLHRAERDVCRAQELLRKFGFGAALSVVFKAALGGGRRARRR